jgi:hypothetical protein
MEIESFLYKLDDRERFYSQSVLVFLLVLGLTLWGNFVVLANPSSDSFFEEDSKVPLSKRAFDSVGEWRAPQKAKKKWRESDEERLTLQNSRIKKETSSLYDPTKAQDNWDPYSSMGHPDTLTRPAKVFEFKF